VSVWIVRCCVRFGSSLSMFWFEVLTTVCENSGGCWFSRPSELVSPRRDY